MIHCCCCFAVNTPLRQIRDGKDNQCNELSVVPYDGLSTALPTASPLNGTITEQQVTSGNWDIAVAGSISPDHIKIEKNTNEVSRNCSKPYYLLEDGATREAPSMEMAFNNRASAFLITKQI